MRRRRHRKLATPTQNLDSFLDILTNTVGVLMFISLFVSLVTVEAGTVIRTPLVSNSRKSPQFFELRDNRLSYVDTSAAIAQVDKFLASLPPCQKPEIPDRPLPSLYEYYLSQIETYQACERNKIQQLALYRGTIDHYSVRVEAGGMAYKLREGTQRELPEELAENNSDFRQLLKQLNPQTDYLAFLVRPDSFKAFRQARQLAWEAGFDVGWEPMERDRAIVFGTGGRAVGVQ